MEIPPETFMGSPTGISVMADSRPRALDCLITAALLSLVLVSFLALKIVPLDSRTRLTHFSRIISFR